VHKTQNVKYTNIGFCSFSLAVNSVRGCEHIFKALTIGQQGLLVILPLKLSIEFPVPVRKNQLLMLYFVDILKSKVPFIEVRL
jgi:hypothetical protein